MKLAIARPLVNALVTAIDQVKCGGRLNAGGDHIWRIRLRSMLCEILDIPPELMNSWNKEPPDSKGGEDKEPDEGEPETSHHTSGIESTRRRRARAALAARRALVQLGRHASQYAFVALITGTSFHTLLMMMCFMGFPVPPERTFYRQQVVTEDCLLRMARDSAGRYRATCRLNTTCGFDGG
jgi:hypothetical protein